MMRLLFILNFPINILMFGLSFAVMMANVMSGANAEGLTALIFVWEGVLFPAIPIISVIGCTIFYKKQNKKWFLIFFGLPWAYMLLVLATLPFLSY